MKATNLLAARHMTGKELTRIMKKLGWSNEPMTRQEFYRIRIKLGWTQMQLATELGYKANPSVSRFEQGQQTIPPWVAGRMRELEREHDKNAARTYRNKNNA